MEREPDEKDPDVQRYLSRFRIIGAAVVLVIAALYVGADIFQLPFLRTTFHLDPTVLGILLGTFAVLVGVEAIARIPGIGRDVK